MKFTYAPGATPIRDEELSGLIPKHVHTQAELNQWEEINIAQAQQWAYTKAKFKLEEGFVRKLHEQMFDKTWSWAGTYRLTNKNIGINYPYITTELANLVEDVSFQAKERTYPPDEIAARLHHRLVYIHPFANGNGRHARLFTDLFLHSMNLERFSWGSRDLAGATDTRKRYIEALRKADQHDYEALLQFVRS